MPCEAREEGECNSIGGCILRIVCSSVAAIVFGQCADLMGPEHGGAGEEGVADLRARRGVSSSGCRSGCRRSGGGAQAGHGAAHAWLFPYLVAGGLGVGDETGASATWRQTLVDHE